MGVCTTLSCKSATDKVLIIWGCTCYVHIQLFHHHPVYKETIFWLKYYTLMHYIVKISNFKIYQQYLNFKVCYMDTTGSRKHQCHIHPKYCQHLFQFLSVAIRQASKAEGREGGVGCVRVRVGKSSMLCSKKNTQSKTAVIHYQIRKTTIQASLQTIFFSNSTTPQVNLIYRTHKY